MGSSIGRQWAELLATYGQFRDRLWAFSHGRRQSQFDRARLGQTFVLFDRGPGPDARAVRVMGAHVTVVSIAAAAWRVITRTGTLSHHARLETGPVARSIDRADAQTEDSNFWEGALVVNMPETDQQSDADAPLPSMPRDLSNFKPVPPIPGAAASQIPPDSRAMQLVGFLKSVNWSKITLKGWIAIAIIVMIPIGLAMKAFGYEPASGQQKPAASSESATDRNLPASASPQPGAASPSNGGANPFGGHAPEDSLMPYLICMNLQDAQNEIQDHGVFFSDSVDATGKGRHQIIDSNWVVVGQSPAAGTPIGEGDAELSVVKYGETSQC